MEHWRTIKEHTRYEVSSHGNVRAKAYVSADGLREYDCKTKSLSTTADGYKRAMLHGANTPRTTEAFNGKRGGSGPRKNAFVHRLVAQAFLDDWDASMDVDHIDRNPSNNHVSNLRMVTRQQNLELRMRQVQKIQRIIDLSREGMTADEIAKIIGA